MTSETAISRWLRTEMPRRGYPLQGHRAGGISRLAQDAGIPQASMSRIVNGGAEPSIESLRKLARLWKIPLGEMLVHAGYADPEDLYLLGPHHTRPTESAVAIPEWVDFRDIPLWEQHIWQTPDLTVEQREGAILLIRLHRGDLADDTKGLLRLSRTLNRVVDRHLDRNGPPQAV